MSRETNTREISFPMGHVRIIKKAVKNVDAAKAVVSLTARLESALNAFKDIAYGDQQTQSTIKKISELQIEMITKELSK